MRASVCAVIGFETRSAHLSARVCVWKLNSNILHASWSDVCQAVYKTAYYSRMHTERKLEPKYS